MTHSHDIDRWVDAGLIDATQASRIGAFEQERKRLAGSVHGGMHISATEVVAYLGAIVVLVGIGLLVGTQSQELGALGRDAVLSLVMAAGLGFGFVMDRRRESPAARRAQAAGFLIGTIASFTLAGQVLVDARVLTRSSTYGDDTSGDIMIAALATVPLAASLLWRSRASLLALPLAALGYGGVAAFEAWSRPAPVGWQAEAWYLLAGALFLGFAHLLLRDGRAAVAGELLRWAALIGPLAAALILSFNEPWLEDFAIALAVASLIVAVRLRSFGLVIAGGLGLFISVLEVGFRHFAATLGYPIVLIASGVALFALSLAMVRILPRLRARGLVERSLDPEFGKG